MILKTPIMCKTTRDNKIVVTKILLDSGAGGMFMNTNFARKHNVQLYPLENPITPKNVDGSLNLDGQITHYTWIRYKLGGTWVMERLNVTRLGAHDLIFGLPWFQFQNPQINWTTGRMSLPMSARDRILAYL